MSYTLKSGAECPGDLSIDENGTPSEAWGYELESRPCTVHDEGTWPVSGRPPTDDERREIAAEMVRRWTAWGGK